MTRFVVSEDLKDVAIFALGVALVLGLIIPGMYFYHQREMAYIQQGYQQCQQVGSTSVAWQKTCPTILTGPITLGDAE